MRTYRFKKSTDTRSQSGIIHHIIPIVCFIVLFAAVGTFLYLRPHAASGPPEIRSALGQWCMNREGNNKVDTQPCTGTTGQQWTLDGDHVKDNGNHCLVPNGYKASENTGVVYDHCSSNAADSWKAVAVSGGYDRLENPNSGYCLAEPAGDKGAQLTLRPCNLDNDQKWSLTHYTSSGGSGGSGSCSGGNTEGDAVCAEAKVQLSRWDSSSNKTALIKDYCHGDYDCEQGEWCAGFVSYVYNKAGHPFGWVFEAKNLGYLAHLKGFTFSETPEVGSIAVSSGLGAGHAQIVISTKGKLTYISGNYGNSVVETQDPSGVVFGYANPN